MPELGPKTDRSKPENDTDRQVDFALPMAFMMNRRSELFHRSYTILAGFGDPIFLQDPIWKAASMREGLTRMDTGAL